MYVRSNSLSKTSMMSARKLSFGHSCRSIDLSQLSPSLRSALLRLEIGKVVVPFPSQLVAVDLPAVLLVWVGIEALCITRVSYRGDDRATVFPIVNLFPVDAFKERV